MYYALSNLKSYVDHMIEQIGPDAPVAAFIFTKEDVCTNYWDADERESVELDCDSLEQTYPGIIEKVLGEVGDSDFIYEQINDSIDDEIKAVRKKGTV